MATNNKLLVSESKKILEVMKNEIANEFNVELGADATARQNGSVGGEMTKRLVDLAQSEMTKSNTVHTIH